jgi:hypothetical protein
VVANFVNRKELQALAVLRIREAKVLLKNDCPDGAYYLAGYAAERAIKACIARRTVRYEFPDKERAKQSWTHNFKDLIAAAELTKLLADDEKQYPDLSANWAIVRKWSTDSRYENHISVRAGELLNALEDRRHGVLRWLKQRW